MAELPETWCIKITPENRDILNHYRCNIAKYATYIIPDEYNYMVEIGFGIKYNSYRLEITTEQFKRLVLKETTVENNKEIIGYKLIKPEYEQACVKICYDLDVQGRFKNENGIATHVGYKATERLKKAGVLDLWFEPVYKETETVVSMGGEFNLTVKNNAVFHKTENITNYVKMMKNWWETNKNLKFNNYDFKIEDVILSKTGCESKTTTMKDWVKVFELID